MPDKPQKPVFAKRSFGQNFLTDQNYIQKIVDALDLSPEDQVIEIGPGRGSLTRPLTEKAGRVLAIEFDRDLIPLLQEQFRDRSNFILYEGDALTADLDALAEGGVIKLAANLPYNISTAILQRLITYKANFSEMVLMFQREVVERIVARPGSRERGYLSVIAQSAFDVERLFDVPGNAFRPVPKVWSSVVRLRPRETPFANTPEFDKLVSAGFRQKRKTIQNNLKVLNIDAAQLLTTAGIDPQTRAEALSMHQWCDLAAAAIEAATLDP